MIFQKFTSDAYCVGGRHRSATKNIYGDVTSKGNRLLIGLCSICNGNKSVTVSDTTKQVEGFGDLFKSLGKKGLNVSKKWQKLFQKVAEELWKLETTLVLHLHFKTLKRLYYHYLK